MAKNEIFSIINKDHYTHQSKELIASLLIYWTNLHVAFNKRFKITNYKTISLKDYLFWGQTVIHKHTIEKIRNYKNFVYSYNHIKLHVILTRPQKIIQAGNII